MAIPGKAAIIYHTGAGRGRASDCVGPVCRQLASHGWTMAGVHRTLYPGHAQKVLAPTLAREIDFIVAIGGDGTLREVCAGLPPATPPVPIGFVPTGSANVVARDLSIPLEAEPAIDLLTTGVARNFDVGAIQTDRNTDDTIIFLAMVEIGFGAKVVHLTQKLRDGLCRSIYRQWGDPVYALAALAALVEPDEKPFQISRGTTSTSLQAYAAVIANTHCYAKSWSMAPAARMDDGRLDLFTRHRSGTGVIIRSYYAASQWRRLSGADGHYCRGRGFEIRSDTPLAIQIDGDPLPPLKWLAVRVMPGQLRLVTPPRDR